MKVQKRDGRIVNFDPTKIRVAVEKANNEVREDDKIPAEQITAMINMIERVCEKRMLSVEEIQDLVEQFLVENGYYFLSKKYILYRHNRSLVRHVNTTDESILSIIDLSNQEAKDENSNKNPILAPTQRDYMAGEVSKDLTNRILLPPDIVDAHKKGLIHFHDADYYSQRMHNCCLVNLEDMLQNGTVISNTMIEKPHSFATACNIATQIVAQVASSQYGGQTISLAHLAPFVNVSRRKYVQEVRKALVEEGISVLEGQIHRLAEERVREEIKRGVQMLQYQVITLMTTNGQAPFITMFLYLDEAKDEQTKKDLALIIEEVLLQRIQGVKNEKGVWVTPAFPKLIYVLDEDNITEDSKYYYLTELAAKCTAKRMVPDYISAKVMKELKGGDVYPCMGCVEGNEMITYRFKGKTYTEAFWRMWNRMGLYFPIKHQDTEDNPNLYIPLRGVDIYDTKQGFVECKTIIRNIANEWMKVHIAGGRTVMCTVDHPFETENRGVVYAKDIIPGDMIAVNRDGVIPDNNTQSFTKNIAWGLGVLLADGNYDTHVTVSLGLDETDIIDKFEHVIQDDLHLIPKRVLQSREKKGEYYDILVTSNQDKSVVQKESDVVRFANYLQTLFGGSKKKDRHIPCEIFTAGTETRYAFLAGMIDADGYINNQTATCKVQIGSTNKELALGQMYLAQSLGMTATLYENHYRANCKDNIRYRVEFVPNRELLDYIVSDKKRNHVQFTEHPHASVTSETPSPVVVTEMVNYRGYSYDVETASEHFEVSGIYSHNCRSFLTPDTEGLGEGGEHKYYGRFNQGVVTINLPDIALSSNKDEEEFWKIFDDRMEHLVHKALRCRHERLKGAVSDIAPILWQHGALARLKPGESIEKLLFNNYSTISIGYAGLAETVWYMKGCSHTDEEGKEFGLRVMQFLNDKAAKWREEENISYSVYGTPLESTTYKFATCLQKRFGKIPHVTDKDYITNSYHIHVTEKIDAFSKLSKEAEFQKLSPGGAISYVEVPNMQNNIPAVLAVMKHIYDTILYAELNTKSDYCMECGYDGEIGIYEDEKTGRLGWKCPNCGNTDQTKMSVARRTCGYIGTNFWNQGRTQEIKERVLHL